MPVFSAPTSLAFFALSGETFFPRLGRLFLLMVLCALVPLAPGGDIPAIPAECPVADTVQSIQKLQRGWNQIYIPILVDEASLQKLLARGLYYKTGAKAGSQTYTRVTQREELSPNRRFWIYGAAEEELLLTGSCLGVSAMECRIDEDSKHWIINDRDTGILAEGKTGEKGEPGEQAPRGPRGRLVPKGIRETRVPRVPRDRRGRSARPLLPILSRITLMHGVTESGWTSPPLWREPSPAC